MKFHLVSLGCAKNTADSEGLAALLRKRGWIWADSPQKAGLVLINTCGFIRDAKEESLGKIMEILTFKKKKPDLKVFAFGCLIKRYFKEIKTEIPELDGLFEFMTEADIEALEEIGNRFHNDASTTHSSARENDTQPRLLTPSHFAYLKIAEGCDNRCSYCAIPDIRGSFRSHQLSKLLSEAKNLADTGAREIIIVAQDTTRFGEDLKGKCLLPELVERIGKIEGIRWIRMQYLHPKRLTPELLEAIFRLPKVLPYFDIPLQHVSDRILTLMNRGVNRKEIEDLLKQIRKSFPGAIIRSTFIVGFPGETETDFELLKDFLEANPIDRVGAFAYSIEDGTPAAKLKSKVSSREKARRLDEIMTLQQCLALERNRAWEGRTLEVIIDRIEKGKLFGRSYGDAPEVDNLISLSYDEKFHVGDFLPVKIVSTDAYDFFAESIA